MPDLLHVVPTGDDAVLDRIVQSEDTTDCNCFVTRVVFFGLRAHYDFVEWPAHNGWEHCPWGIIASEARFDHPAPVVNHQSTAGTASFAVLRAIGSFVFLSNSSCMARRIDLALVSLLCKWRFTATLSPLTFRARLKKNAPIILLKYIACQKRSITPTSMDGKNKHAQAWL